ncbi:uncharacterized protein ARMOST_21413 [Armillaria ostoyae]|uniref:Uncharacterized protein n=1 Tax=Armillaria ostoyae TaxID=47428 RepID=A0A284SA41_ARMOS|nr:uncharacterized protein ARMOST_21413 [Armillaria ostoyae]
MTCPTCQCTTFAETWKTFEVKYANQTVLIRLGRFLPHTLRTLKNFGITKVDNGVSGPRQLLPWELSVRPLSLDSSERLIIDIGFKVGYYADYLRWWISGISEATNIRSIHIRIAMAVTYLDKAEDKPWKSVWQAFNSVLLDKQSLEQVVVLFQIPSFPRTFLARKRDIEIECKDLIERGIMRVVLPKTVHLETLYICVIQEVRTYQR